MQLSHATTLSPTGQLVEGVSRVSCLSWTSQKLATASSDRVVQLYDSELQHMDKFVTKKSSSASAESKSYVIKAIAFNVGGTKIAVGQSDGSVYVYKLGLQKKSICNKFLHDVSVTCICWPCGRERRGDGAGQSGESMKIRDDEYEESGGGGSGESDVIVFGLADGTVKVGYCRNNKSTVVYTINSFVLATCSCWSSVLCLHGDGSINRVAPSTATHSFFARLSGVQPTAMAWGLDVMVVTASRCLMFYDQEGKQTQTIDCLPLFSTNPPELSAAGASPTGATMCIGTSRASVLLVYKVTSSLQLSNRKWTLGKAVDLADSCWGCVCTVEWASDGGRIAIGGSRGVVEVLDVCAKKWRWRDRYEFVFVAENQVICKDLVQRSRWAIKCDTAIDKLAVHSDRYLSGVTQRSIILCDMQTKKWSDVPWEGDSLWKLHFKFHPLCCVIQSGCELFLVEYGQHHVIGTLRTAFVSPRLISIKMYKRDKTNTSSTITVASLLDKHSISLSTFNRDPCSRATDGYPDSMMQCSNSMCDDEQVGGNVVSHNSEISWLSLTSGGERIVFRDRKKSLSVCRTSDKLDRHTLLGPSCCSKVMWVDGETDVLVAQNKYRVNTLCVWYSLSNPDQLTNLNVKGNLVRIVRVRERGRTVAILDVGGAEHEYELDDALTGFTSLLDRKDYSTATDLLLRHSKFSSSSSTSTSTNCGGLGINSTTNRYSTMWQQLASSALADGQLAAAAVGYSCAGDVATARYVYKLVKSGARHVYNMRADKGEKREGEVGQQTEGEAEEGKDGGETQIDKWEEIGGREDVVVGEYYIVQARLAMLRKQYGRAENILLTNNALQEAIQMYQQVHRYDDAIRLAEQHSHPQAVELKRQYLVWLTETGQEAKAGQLEEREGNYQKAVEIYLEGGLYTKAAQVVLSGVSAGTHRYPKELLQKICKQLSGTGQIVGDIYMCIGQTSAALDEYRQGHCYRKAVEVAKGSFPGKVLELEEEWGDWLVASNKADAAVSHFIEANSPHKAIEATIVAKQWSKAEVLLSSTLTQQDAKPFFLRVAEHYVSSNQLSDAERLFIQGGEAKEAVKMHIAAGQLQQANALGLREIGQRGLWELYSELIEGLQNEGKLQEAERLYILCEDYDSAISMWKEKKQYDKMLQLVATYR
eukprot:GHVQ01017139.1.p1 GENE.GHVQ01017139.1~~GHVQ01017139.1.p1  ORF type:complete len:1156 (-),score=203.19 GHVQ01017139.1:3791-7258(-)